MISPITVCSSVVNRELPYLFGVTALAALLFYYDGELNRRDAVILILVFLVLVAWTIYTGLKTKEDQLADEVEQALSEPLSMKVALLNTVLGLFFLVVSSRMLVWGGRGSC